MRGIFRAPARVTFGRSPKSDQKVCLKPQVSRLPARYAFVLVDSIFRTVVEILLCRAVKRIVSAPAPLPLTSAMVEADASIFQGKGAALLCIPMCRGGVLPRPKHCAKSAGGAEPLPYTRFCEGTDENRLSLRQNRRFCHLPRRGRRGRGTTIPPSWPKAMPPPSQREALGIPRLRARGADRHVASLLAMTVQGRVERSGGG